MWNQAGGSPDTSLRYIVPIVLAAHVVLMFFMKFQSDLDPPYKPKEHIIVTTVQIGEKSPSPAKKVTVRQTPPPEPEPIAPPAPKVEEAPEPIEEIAEEIIPEPEPELIPEPEPEPEPAPKPEEKPAPKKEPKKEPKKTPTPLKEAKKEIKATKKESAPKKTVVQAEKKKPEKKSTDTKKKEIKKPVAETEPKKKASVEKKDKAPPKAKAESDSKPKVSDTPKIDPKVEAAKAAVKAKQQELLKSAKESIAKIDKSPHKITSSDISDNTNRIAPARIEKLEIDALPSGGSAGTTFTTRELGYRDELVHRLKLMLRLPEFGEVKVQLTLERSGHVAKVVIVSTESSANKKYIEKTLPTISFPGFGDNFSSQSQYTFLISLSNDI